VPIYRDFVQQDQMARPAINTVFLFRGQPKDDFNAAIPSAMGAKYQPFFNLDYLNKLGIQQML
jgi:hypothetical protein